MNVVHGDLPTACQTIADAPGPCDGAICQTEGPRLQWITDADSPAPGQLRVLGGGWSERRIARFDGSRWRWETPWLYSMDVVAFAGVAPDDVWAVGNDVFRFDGSAWNVVEVPVELHGRFSDVVAFAADDVWLLSPSLDAMLHWDGEAWTTHPIPIAAERLVVDADGGRWLQGREAVARWDGADWQVFSVGSTDHPILALAGSPREGLFVARSGQPLLKWDGSGFVPFPIPAFDARSLVAWDGAVWMVGENQVTENVLYRWIDGRVEMLDVPDGWGRIDRLVDAGSALWSISILGIARWDGSCWQVHDLTMEFPQIAGPSEDYLWAFHNDGVARWDGDSWRPVDVGTKRIADAWVAGPDEIWTVGGGPMLRIKGDTFTQWGNGTVDGGYIAGTSPDDVWVASGGGSAWHWNGAAWEEHPIPGDWFILDLKVAGNEVWVMGTRYLESMEYESVAMRWNGAGWEVMRVDPVRYGSLAIRGDGDVWIFGLGFALRWNGVSWTILSPDGTQLGPNAFWVDEDGVSIGDTQGIHSIGGRPLAPRFIPHGVLALCRDSSDATWLVDGLGRVHRLVGEVLEAIEAPIEVRHVACGAPDDVWFASAGSLAHWDGAAITWVAAFTWAPIEALWSTGPDDLWVVADSMLVHWDGSTWTEMVVPGVDVSAVHASSPSDVWAVGADGRAAHWDGTTWTVTQAPTENDLMRVWSSGPDRAWAIGGGRLFTWDGSAWASDFNEGFGVWRLAGYGGKVWISGQWQPGLPSEVVPARFPLRSDAAEFFVRDATGTWRQVEHAVWGSIPWDDVVLGADGRFAFTSSRFFFESGEDPALPWEEVEFPIWTQRVLWRDPAGVVWLATDSGVVRWHRRAP